MYRKDTLTKILKTVCSGSYLPLLCKKVPAFKKQKTNFINVEMTRT